MSKNSNSDLSRFTGLWEKTSGRGNIRLEGRVNSGIRVVIFKNDKKEPDSNQPDYQAYLAPALKEGEQSSDDSLLRLTGLWEKTSEKGVFRLEGKVNDGLRLLVFKNTRKEPDSNQPDYNSYLAPIRHTPES